MNRSDYINSEHSYERLNWLISFKKPLIKGNFVLGQNCPPEIYNHIVEELKEEDNNNIPLMTPPTYIITYLSKMLEIFEINKFNRFMTLTRDPKMMCCFSDLKRKVKKHYGLMTQEQQIRSMKESIYKFFQIRNLDSYIIVYEQTKKGVIHSHIVYRMDNEEDNDCLAYMSEIENYKNYEKAKLNIHVVDELDNNLPYYLCKVKEKPKPQTQTPKPKLKTKPKMELSYVDDYNEIMSNCKDYEIRRSRYI